MVMYTYIVMSRVTKNSVSTIEFYRLFLIKRVMDYVEIYART